VDEIEECVEKYGIREFNFFDDTFVLLEKRVIEVCEEIKRRNLDVSWICFGRANTVTRRSLEAIKSAGCKKISFGLESGSQEILTKMRKKITLEQSRNAVKLSKRVGLKVHASFMLGNIGETKETIRKTIDFAKSLPLANATFFITSPYPGTELYEIAIEKGFINNKTRWEDFAPISGASPPLVQQNLDEKELIKLQKIAFREFYVRPKYILNKILELRSLEDIKSVLSGVNLLFNILKK
jgi:radical SAM superfamily enzyme YgiQ (UPF0313 family)